MWNDTPRAIDDTSDDGMAMGLAIAQFCLGSFSLLFIVFVATCFLFPDESWAASFGFDLVLLVIGLLPVVVSAALVGFGLMALKRFRRIDDLRRSTLWFLGCLETAFAAVALLPICAWVSLFLPFFPDYLF